MASLSSLRLYAGKRDKDKKSVLEKQRCSQKSLAETYLYLLTYTFFYIAILGCNRVWEDILSENFASLIKKGS